MSDVRELSNHGSVPDYELRPSVRAEGVTQLKALGDPVRNAILHLVLERAASTTELAAALGRAKGTVDHHVKVLAAAGLLRVVRTRKVRAMTEHFWGRSGRTIEIGTPEGVSEQDSMFVGEAMKTFRPDGRDYITLRYARIADDRVAEFRRRLDELATEFTQLERGGTTVHGLLLALAATNQPVLPDIGDA